MSTAHHAKPTPTAVRTAQLRGETDFLAGSQRRCPPTRPAGPPPALSHAPWMKYGPFATFLILGSAAGMPASGVPSGTLAMVALVAMVALATLLAAPRPGRRAGSRRGKRA